MVSLRTPPGEPSFVSPDEVPKCEMCRKVVRDAMTTTCGHRMCEGCMKQLFVGKQGPVVCPGREEDCVGQVRSVIRPDTAARRIVRELHVRCGGCHRQMPWKDLEMHSCDDCSSNEPGAVGGSAGGTVNATAVAMEMQVELSPDYELEIIVNQKLEELQKIIDEAVLRMDLQRLKLKARLLKAKLAEIQTRIRRIEQRYI